MTSLNLGDKFDTSNVTYMSEMFHSCGYKSLKSLDLGDHFDTSKVHSMGSMFPLCGYESMTSLDLGDKFDLSSITYMKWLFTDCGHESLKSLYFGTSLNNAIDSDLGVAAFERTGNEQTNFYATEQFKEVIDNRTDVHLNTDHIKIIQTRNIENAFINKIKKVNGSKQSFDLDSSVLNQNEFDIYYSDCIPLTSGNFNIMGSKDQPSFDKKGEYENQSHFIGW